MAQPRKNNLKSGIVNNNPRDYSYNKQTTLMNLNSSNINIFDDKYSYNQTAMKIDLQTGAHQAASITSNIKAFIEKHITSKISHKYNEVKGKITSLFEKWGWIKSEDPKDEIELNDYRIKETDNSTTKPSDIEHPSPKGEEVPEPVAEETTTEPQTTKPSITTKGHSDEITQKLINNGYQLYVEGVDPTVRTDCKQYTIGGDINTNHKSNDGALSAKEREMLIYLAYHEAGSDPVQATAIVSAYLNGWEHSYYNFGEYMAEACSQYSEKDDFAANTSNFRYGTYTYDQVNNLYSHKLMVSTGEYDQVAAIVDNVLSGTRNNNATQWRGGFSNPYAPGDRNKYIAPV